MRQDLKIFIASSSELDNERRETIYVTTELNKKYPHLHIEPVLFEVDTASGNNPGHARIQDKINPLLDASHIVVVMSYSKIGAFTLEEYRRAKAQNKKIFFYLKKGFTPTTSAQNKEFGKLLKLKEQIEKESSLRYETFDKTNDFNDKLYKDLQKHIDEHFPPPQGGDTDTQSPHLQNIPLPPRPFFAPAFPLQKTFTGRTEEMKMLSEWYLIEKEPVCVVEALGGMGKSSLTWKWLENTLPESNPKPQGIIWWSFYKQGFNDFLESAYNYCCHDTAIKGKKVDKLTELITCLSNNRFLIILDGFETQIRLYAGMMGMFQNEHPDEGTPLDEFQSECPNPYASKFLENICAGQSKVLITSRLFPKPLLKMSGVKHIKLTGLSPTDTLEFFKNQKIEGSPSEILRAAKVYNFHPLMLSHLAAALSRCRIKHIQDAYTQNIIDEKEPQKILNTSYATLNEDEKLLASSLSVFRNPFSFEAVQAMFPNKSEQELWQTLNELKTFGFLSYEETEQLFDFHPINRLFLYNKLTNKEEAHQKAIGWFENRPERELITSFQDLVPVFEMAFHLIKAGLLNEAYGVYYDRLFDYTVGPYERPQEVIDLLQELIKSKQQFNTELYEYEQARVLSDLGIILTKVLRVKEALRYLSQAAMLYDAYDYDSKSYYSLAVQGTIWCDLSHTTSGNILIIRGLTKIGIDNDIRLLYSFRYKMYWAATYKGAFDNAVNEITVFQAQSKNVYTLRECERIKTQYCLHGYASADFPLNNTFQYLTQFISTTVNNAKKGENNGILNCYIHMYKLLGETLLQYIKTGTPFPPRLSVKLLQSETGHETDIIYINSQNAPDVCIKVLYKALLKIRETNILDIEAEVLLLIARAQWQQAKIKAASLLCGSIQLQLESAQKLAAKGDNNRILIALHIFCAEALMEVKEGKDTKQLKLLGLSAKAHLETTKDLCLDKSQLSDLFKPKDINMDEFYKDIPEYEMLKRGLTSKERIERGYYYQWKHADGLLKQL